MHQNQLPIVCKPNYITTLTVLRNNKTNTIKAKDSWDDKNVLNEAVSVSAH